MGINYLKNASTTTQSDILPGQVPNSSGAAVWQIDDFQRVERFLILGAEGGSYYATEQKLTKENALAVQRAIKLDGPRVVKTIVEISDAGRAPKNDPAIYALALCAKLGNESTRTAAYQAVPKVCRIGTHLYHFVAFCESINGGGGWGRGMRRAVSNWFNDKSPSDLALQLVKYQSRDGWSSRDLLRLAHPIPKTEDHRAIFNWATQGYDNVLAQEKSLVVPTVIQAFEEAKTVENLDRLLKLITDYKLPREAIPTQWLTKPEVWQALLPHMGLTALIRNIPTLTRVGLVSPLSETTKFVIGKLGNAGALRKSRIHPIQLLSALLTYKSGHSTKGSSTWTPVRPIIDALDMSFYAAFSNVVPTGKNTLLALDVSGSMSGGSIAGIPGLSPREGSAAMALVTAATEPNHHIMGFSSTFVPLNISPRMRLDEVVRHVSGLPFAHTDCSLPMRWAKDNKVPVETFHIYTDNETNAFNQVQPSEALRNYRKATGLQARLAVIAMIPNSFSIADPNDPGMLDVHGFDTNAPSVIADFARGGGAETAATVEDDNEPE